MNQKIIGIIAEYNHFHLGHLYQINEIKKKYPNSTLILITNSNFTQRGDVSIINKWDKAKIALNNQIDYLRDKKLLDIKAKINKMPTKISVISVLFVIPIILLLVLGPVIINYLLNT